MPAKPPSRSVTTVEVHNPPLRSNHDHLPRHDASHAIRPAEPSLINGQTSGRIPDSTDPDMISQAPSVSVSETHSYPTAIPAPPLLEAYRVGPNIRLPVADASGFRRLKGRQFVDMHDGSILQISLDPDTALYRARLGSESRPSGPILFHDPDSNRWHPLIDFEKSPLPLSASRLANFRTPLDFSGADPDSDGLHRFEGKRYVIIENHAHQVMRDVDASSPQRNVWRVVNPKDPVAADSENVYRASRSGETLAITRNSDGIWTTSLDGLKGGMRRTAQTQDSKAYLLQKYEPIRNAFEALVTSNKRYGELWDSARDLPEGSQAEKEALIRLEVHIIKHTRMQAEYVKSLIDNKDWLILLKAGGLYKSELHTQQLNRVDYLNKLIAAMDHRVYPTTHPITVESLKSNFAHLNKKLKIMNDRQDVMDQIRKADRSATSDLDDMNRGVPTVDQIHSTQYNICLRLISDDPENPPPFGMRSAMALHLLKKDLHQVYGDSEALALHLTLENIRSDRAGFESLDTSADPVKAQYVSHALSLMHVFETKIDNRLNAIHEQVDSNSQLPLYDQDIDFDFLPEQSAAEAEATAPRKLFRTRHHGTYRVLVGEQDTAADGSITLKVPDLFKPHQPPQRYENIEGEWQQVRPAVALTPRPQLVSDATESLQRVNEYVTQARIMEARKANPTNIVEFLGAETDRFRDLAQRLEATDRVTEDAEVSGLISRLRTAAASMETEGQSILIRMYKNKDVLDVLRLNFLLDHSQLKVVKTVERKQMGKGRDKSFLDVYSINDRSDNSQLWEAHFHYDRQDRAALDYTLKGAHMKTLGQSKLGSAFQQREAQAGRPHQRIWRELISPRVAQKLFDHLT
ncbi:hypothetical protein [Pseudomonas fluorescens]|uniref:hypothetical protein n=1 Tax=Pseudomonas fluorescens TaxID=294 RepID=UPI002B1E1D48|nr:hypothetical protein [Pseudomonas fluorescens]